MKEPKPKPTAARMSPIWTATYATTEACRPFWTSCWSVTWGQKDGQSISAVTAVRLARKFLEDHRFCSAKVPALLEINYLYPYEHHRIGYASANGESRYHEDTEA